MTIEELTARMHEFVRSKGWYEPDSPKQQSPRNLAISLSIEVNEILELYQWGDTADPAKLKLELADVTLYLLQLASMTGIDLEQAVLEKLKINADRSW